MQFDPGLEYKPSAQGRGPGSSGHNNSGGAVGINTGNIVSSAASRQQTTGGQNTGVGGGGTNKDDNS